MRRKADAQHLSVSFSPDGGRPASAGATLRLLQIDLQAELSVTVMWVAGQPSLSLQGADLQGVKGLTQQQKRLIKQRGGDLDGDNDDSKDDE